MAGVQPDGGRRLDDSSSTVRLCSVKISQNTIPRDQMSARSSYLERASPNRKVPPAPLRLAATSGARYTSVPLSAVICSTRPLRPDPDPDPIGTGLADPPAPPAESRAVTAGNSPLPSGTLCRAPPLDRWINCPARADAAVEPRRCVGSNRPDNPSAPAPVFVSVSEWEDGAARVALTLYSPKSANRSRNLSVTNKLSGLMSRCNLAAVPGQLPPECMCATARAESIAIRSRVGQDSTHRSPKAARKSSWRRCSSIADGPARWTAC